MFPLILFCANFIRSISTGTELANSLEYLESLLIFNSFSFFRLSKSFSPLLVFLLHLLKPLTTQRPLLVFSPTTEATNRLPVQVRKKPKFIYPRQTKTGRRISVLLRVFTQACSYRVPVYILQFLHKHIVSV